MEAKEKLTLRELATASGQVFIYGSVYSSTKEPSKPVKLAVVTGLVGITWLDVGFWAGNNDLAMIEYMRELLWISKVSDMVRGYAYTFSDSLLIINGVRIT